MHAGSVDALDQFRAVLMPRGILPPEAIVADGGLHRCHAAGHRGRGDSTAVAR